MTTQGPNLNLQILDICTVSGDNSGQFVQDSASFFQFSPDGSVILNTGGHAPTNLYRFNQGDIVINQ